MTPVETGDHRWFVAFSLKDYLAIDREAALRHWQAVREREAWVDLTASKSAVLRHTGRIIEQIFKCVTARRAQVGETTPPTGLENGAGDGDRTHDIQLGKLTFYR